ncbi:MAG: hypothetical protein UR52_C0010G0010 [Candidatus Gottesmanbacteria bacterium GW2011_GWA1_34_13]|uniref:Purine nucleoside phosphorylase n=1 Tax=Candidatus Gottesmanbacteria bacterium GW2011_GWA1_34_13 TaxID=1618434 RepID=A0A0G0DVM3_9BACT|nr:MAG: hypothetical protein UR52_C0010G0010 [Candidatus Gottesmanbacteria bacterium GW2011_GWA1_34_13]
MSIKHSDGIISFSIFDKFPELICFFSTRKLGNLNVGKLPLSNAKKMLNFFNIDLIDFAAMNQIHGNIISQVDKSNKGKLFLKTDGLITQDKNLFLGVKTADCVPLFFYDSKQKIVGIVHAGWKGTLINIVQKMIENFVKNGSDVKNIFVVIGPHIGSCCYDISKERADKFTDKFQFPKSIKERKGKYYLDLGYVNLQILLNAGVNPEHIELSYECTSCKNDIYFSYRKDTVETYGEMMGIIGIRN